MKKHVRILAFLLAVAMVLCAVGGAAAKSRKKKKNATPTPQPAVTATVQPAASPASEAEAEEGPIITPQGIADYLFAYGELPPNFITKAEARELGWQTVYKHVSDAAPGMSIGGDRYGNYQGLLPAQKGRKYFEADCNYVSGNRGPERIVYSSDGLVYYTDDHYRSFIRMKPSTD